MSFDDTPSGNAARAPKTTKRRRGALAPTIIVLMVLTSLIGAFAELWTDVLWFDQLGYSQVFQVRLFTQIGLFLAGLAMMASAVAFSMWFAYRKRPLYAPATIEQTGMERYRQAIEPIRKTIAFAVPIGMGLFAGSAAASQWMQALMFMNRTSFANGEGEGVDPQWQIDAGFYVFTLPALRFMVGFGIAVTVVSLIAAAVVHYVYGGIRLAAGGPKTTVTARVQISIILAVLLLLRAGGYFLDRYSLLTSDSKLFTGAGYTDINAVIPAAMILAGISIVVSLLFVATAFTGGWRLPAVGVSLMVISALVVGSAYPALVQRFQVEPSEKTKEAPYLQQNIAATREAYGLNNIEVTNYNPAEVAEAGALRSDAETTASIRLLDPALVSPSFRQNERVRQYYTFPDPLDVDRYVIDGESKDAVVAVRELDLGGLPQENRSWINDHAVFTHGFGLVAAYGAQRGPGGEPLFFQEGIPSTGELGEFEPRIYFGEESPEFSIVGAPEGAEPRELDYPTDEGSTGQANTTFKGEGGPSVSNLWNRLLYAIKFRDQNILLSDAITSESQILYDRAPRERVKKVAPWLTVDADPYPAVVDGRIKWIVDAYTVTRDYPYSQAQAFGEATRDELTRQNGGLIRKQEVNYIRNSVKATVDAYDGSVNLYVWDEEDPLLQTYMKIFPDSVKPMADISGDLMSHLRYPEDLFKVQRTIFGKYHVEGADEFYSTQDFWKVPPDPTAKDAAQAAPQPPYYLTLKMPGQDDASFSLTTSYIPNSTQQGQASVLTSFMAVDADAGSQAGERAEGYGTMRVLQLPRNTTAKGPGQVQNEFNSDTVVSESLNILARGDSSVLRGNLLTLPVGGGLLYVQPVYVKSAGETAFPQLRRVLVLFGNEVGYAPTLNEALDQVFGGDSGANAGDADVAPGEGDAGNEGENEDGESDGASQPDRPATGNTDLAKALQDASDALKDGEDALKNSDFGAYGEAQERLQKALERALAAETATASASSETPAEDNAMAGDDAEPATEEEAEAAN